MRREWVTYSAKPTMLRTVPAASPKAMLLSLESVLIVGAFVVSGTGAMLLLRNWFGASSPAGVEEHGQTDNRGSPGTWEILSSPRQIPGRRHRANNSRPFGLHWVRRERNAQCNRGTAKRRITKRGGTGGRKSQRLDSTAEAGELSPEDPVEGSEASVGRLNRGKHAEHIVVLSHVHVTRLIGIGTIPRAAAERGTGCASARTSGSVGALGG